VRVLVTGGAGFLGSFLCQRLLENGDEVICMDNFLTGSPRNIEHLAGHPAMQIIKHDVTESVPVPDGLQLVLHFASPASPADYLAYPLETLTVGSVGTLNALDLARVKKARFVLASTSEVYGDPLEHPQRETYWGNVNPIGPRSVYDEAKRFAESSTMAHRDVHGTDTGIVRIFNTYGPRMRPADGRAIPTFIRQALLGEPITVTGDGLQTRSVCYVDDTVSGILSMAGSDLAGPVNIGGPDELTVLALARTIRDLAGSSSPIRFISSPQDDPRVRCPDISLAADRLGWRPAIETIDGLRRTIEWFSGELGIR
jgi:dTDP-glucose 4,6-dehydratase